MGVLLVMYRKRYVYGGWSINRMFIYQRRGQNEELVDFLSICSYERYIHQKVEDKSGLNPNQTFLPKILVFSYSLCLIVSNHLAKQNTLVKDVTNLRDVDLYSV